MDTVVFDGVEYIKASVLAKQFRYTPDYLGQLCRAKKLDARLVGRTWFVNPDSVTEHRRKKKLKTAHSKTKEVSDLPRESKLERKHVLPVVQNRTIKATNDLAIKIAGVETRKLNVAYEKDDENLMPTLTKKKVGPAKTIRIEQVNAKKIKITGKRKDDVSFEADEIPEVSLSGKLKISTVPDAEPEDNKPKEPAKNVKSSFENRLISDEQDSTETNKVRMKSPTSDDNDTVNAQVPLKVSRKKLKLTDIGQGEISPRIKTAPGMPADLSPQHSNPSPVQLEPKTPTVLLVSPLIATVLGLVFVLLIFSASSKVVVFDSEYESKIILQMANLLEIFSQ